MIGIVSGLVGIILGASLFGADADAIREEAEEGSRQQIADIRTESAEAVDEAEASAAADQAAAVDEAVADAVAKVEKKQASLIDEAVDDALAKSKKAAVAEDTKPQTLVAATDPHFRTCGEANGAGFGNYRRGVDTEYEWYQDRDGDGVVCE